MKDKIILMFWAFILGSNTIIALVSYVVLRDGAVIATPSGLKILISTGACLLMIFSNLFKGVPK